MCEETFNNFKVKTFCSEIQQKRSLHKRKHSSAMNRREALTLTTTWTRTWRSVRGADTEGHPGCDSADGKRPEQAKPQTQTVGSWLSGAGG